MITAEYSGSPWATCMGKLVVRRDGSEIAEFTDFYSTGRVRFDEEWNEHVEDGELLMGDERGFLEWATAQSDGAEIVTKVKECLSGVYVCCGGCV